MSESLENSFSWLQHFVRALQYRGLVGLMVDGVSIIHDTGYAGEGTPCNLGILREGEEES